MTRKSKTKAGISRHPLFATLVAVWFAALLGLGSLALRASLLEAAVRAVRLDLLVPAAAPPLGLTARLLVALLFALAGGSIGFLAARAMAPRRPRPAAAPAATATAPIVTPAAAPMVDDDNDDLARLEAARDSIPLRRRGLMAQPADDPFMTPLPPSVPVPGILSVGELTAVEPLGADSVAPAPDIIAPLPPLAPAAPEPAPEPLLATKGDAAPAPALRLAPRDGNAAERLRNAPLDTLGVVELVERFALALAARRARAPMAAAPAAPETVPATVAASAPFADPNPPLPASGRPFDMPAMLRSPLPSGSVEWFADESEPLDAGLPARSLGVSPHASFTAPTTPADAIKASPGWLLPEPDEDPEGEEDDELGSYGDADPDDETGAPVATAADDGEALAERFSSLLDMKPSTRQFGLDPLEPPVRLPPLAQAGGAGTDDALREALATLQRMSGAA